MASVIWFAFILFALVARTGEHSAFAIGLRVVLRIDVTWQGPPSWANPVIGTDVILSTDYRVNEKFSVL